MGGGEKEKDQDWGDYEKSLERLGKGEKRVAIGFLSASSIQPYDVRWIRTEWPVGAIRISNEWGNKYDLSEKEFYDLLNPSDPVRSGGYLDSKSIRESLGEKSVHLRNIDMVIFLNNRIFYIAEIKTRRERSSGSITKALGQIELYYNLFNDDYRDTILKMKDRKILLTEKAKISEPIKKTFRKKEIGIFNLTTPEKGRFVVKPWRSLI